MRTVALILACLVLPLSFGMVDAHAQNLAANPGFSVEGYPDGNYHPDWQVKRAEMASITPPAQRRETKWPSTSLGHSGYPSEPHPWGIPLQRWVGGIAAGLAAEPVRLPDTSGHGTIGHCPSMMIIVRPKNGRRQ